MKHTTKPTKRRYEMSGELKEWFMTEESVQNGPRFIVEQNCPPFYAGYFILPWRRTKTFFFGKVFLCLQTNFYKQINISSLERRIKSWETFVCNISKSVFFPFNVQYCVCVCVCVRVCEVMISNNEAGPKPFCSAASNNNFLGKTRKDRASHEPFLFLYLWLDEPTPET